MFVALRAVHRRDGCRYGDRLMVGRPDLSGPAHGGYCRVPAYHPEAGHYRGGDRGICHLDCRPRCLTYLFEHKERGRAIFWRLRPLSQKLSGGDLLSQGVAPQVPSALFGFTSVFGKGTGGSQTLTPPDKSSSAP